MGFLQFLSTKSTPKDLVVQEELRASAKYCILQRDSAETHRPLNKLYKENSNNIAYNKANKTNALIAYFLIAQYSVIHRKTIQITYANKNVKSTLVNIVGVI
uniref:Uncharacterized protein n=1 Tax=Octopus bimaculoides TaxID=37653 RepID=A0A0L8G2P9_OCTBM